VEPLKGLPPWRLFMPRVKTADLRATDQNWKYINGVFCPMLKFIIESARM
jgi:hypothetical protein